MDMEYLQNLDVQLLVGGAVAVLAIAVGAAYLFSSKKPKDPENFKEFKLVKRLQLSHNVAKFTFELPTPTSVLGLPIGQHISCRKEIVKMIFVGSHSDGIFFNILYHATCLLSLLISVNSMQSVANIIGRFRYQPGQVRAFGMTAGGSGITPMFQVTRAILENPNDKTKVHLIYANVTYEDILLKEELDGFAAKYPDQFTIYYVLNQPPESWNGGVGFVSKEMIQTHCPAPASDIQVLRCGPPPMNKAMAAHLEALGYTSEMLFQF
ncbi:hypothetical protein CISIN_1g024591mg [Citrus sinensis]|uniref:cytochrome-b5 reductase n=1 Tax=Citrus sinensis TaxID=2711 RepID=A0A067E6U1_CITSI|nr:hypothetical protein CISIN_1g024591mg [Citrus sinensis]